MLSLTWNEMKWNERPEMMKLLGKTKSNINKDENGENVPRLEITEVVVVHYNNVNNNYQQDSIFLYTFVSNKSFGQLLDVSPEVFLFQKSLNLNFYILKYGSLNKILNW